MVVAATGVGAAAGATGGCADATDAAGATAADATATRATATRAPDERTAADAGGPAGTITGGDGDAADAGGPAGTIGGGAGRNTAGGDGDGCVRAAAGVACDIGARTADGGAPRGRGAAGCAYAMGARTVDGGTMRGRGAAGEPLGAERLVGGAPECTAGALAGAGALGNGTIGICAAWLRGGAASAPVTGIVDAVALGGGAVCVADVDQGELAVGAPGQDGPGGQGAPGIGAPGVPAGPGGPGGPELATGRIMAIHRSSRSLTAASRRWTAASMTFSIGTPALSAIAIVWMFACNDAVGDEGAAAGATGTTGAAIGGIAGATGGGIAAPAPWPSSAARKVRAAMVAAARCSGVAPEHERRN